MNADFLDSRNIYRAYISCRRRKNCTYNAQKFRLRFSQNMVGLTRALQEIFKPHGWIWKFFKLCGEKVVLRTEFIKAEKRAKFGRIFNGKSFDFILEF